MGGDPDLDPAPLRRPPGPPAPHTLDPHALGDQQGGGQRVGRDRGRQPPQQVPIGPPAAGVEVGEVKRPFYMPAGEFRVADPDGYVLLIGQLGDAS